MTEDDGNNPPADRPPAQPYDRAGERALTPRPARGSFPAADATDASPAAGREVGGPKGPEPTRYGDWERKGRCIDF